MVLSNIPIPATRASDIGERWACEPTLGFSDQGSDQVVIDQYVSDFRELLAKDLSLTARFERLHKLAESEPDLEGLDKASDDLLLDRMYQFGLYAEGILTRLEVLDCRVSDLEQWRDKGKAWNQAAEDLLQELRRLKTLYKENEATMRKWSNQLCEECERRHPELPKLPFEPLDLGATNSARLPSVL